MIEVKNVKAGYDNKQVLNGISFTVDKGECLSVVGKNGCGKSTLLRAMCGIIDFEGEVIIDGVDLKKYKSKDLARKVCMLSQSTHIYFNYTVYDTVMMGRYPHQKGGVFGGISKEDRIAVEEALSVVDIYDLKDEFIDELSGGQLQRVFLAKVIAQDPEILLLDEPTNHLDLNYQIELIKFLKVWIKEKGKTVVGVIHDLNLAMELSKKTLLIGSGEVIAYGENLKVFTSNSFKEIYNREVVDFMVNSFKKWELIGKAITSVEDGTEIQGGFDEK